MASVPNMVVRACLNRTSVGLKLYKQTDRILKEMRLNRTSVGLKLVPVPQNGSSTSCLNRTSVGLK